MKTAIFGKRWFLGFGLMTLTTATLLLSCSNPHKVKDLEEDKIEAKGSYMGATIGVNDDKEAVVRTETTAETELKRIAWKNYDLEQRIASEHEVLSRCRDEIADPRLGGAGKIVEIPELDNLKPPTEVKEEMGITASGTLAIVKKEMLYDRLQSEKKYADSLASTLKLIEKHKKSCERDMGHSRAKYGLPANRFAAQGHYEGGKYIQTRGPEKTLDDAFRFASEEASAARPKQ